MVDIFALSLPHVLMLIAVWRLLSRDDLDAEVAPADQGEGPRV